MSERKGSSDEAIGRPKEWREGRYQQPGKAVDRSVSDPSQLDDKLPGPASTPVTKKDYEQPRPPAAERD